MGERRADLIRERRSYVKNEFGKHHYHDGRRRRQTARGRVRGKGDRSGGQEVDGLVGGDWLGA